MAATDFDFILYLNDSVEYPVHKDILLKHSFYFRMYLEDKNSFHINHDQDILPSSFSLFIRALYKPDEFCYFETSKANEYVENLNHFCYWQTLDLLDYFLCFQLLEQVETHCMLIFDYGLYKFIDDAVALSEHYKKLQALADRYHFYRLSALMLEMKKKEEYTILTFLKEKNAIEIAKN